MSTTEITMSSSSKIARIDTRDDLITKLEQPVINHILSFLPTKDAVRTSVLSKDWLNKWTYLNNVDIDDLIHGMPTSDTLPDFMDRIILLCKHLTSFRLRCSKSGGLTRMQAWLSDLLTRDLENVNFTCKITGIVIPSSLLNSTSLRKLRLMVNGSTLTLPEKNFAPNLTSLYLFAVEIVGGGDPSTSTLTFTFPVLESFSVNCCKWLNVKLVEIQAPMLTTFLTAPMRTVGLVKDYDYSFVIDAPQLNNFTLWGLPENFIMDGSSVVSAFLRSEGQPGKTAFRRDIGLRVQNLINGFTNLEELEMSDYITKCLMASKSGLPPFRFDKLRRLAFMDCVTAARLFELLHAAPSLKMLHMNVAMWADYDYGAMEPIPSCIAHLEEVGFFLFDCKTSKYNLAKFFLEKGEQLKKISFDRFSPRNKLEEVKEVLSTFPRVSPCVTFDFPLPPRQPCAAIDALLATSQV